MKVTAEDEDEYGGAEIPRRTEYYHLRNIIAEEMARMRGSIQIHNDEGIGRDALLKWLLGIASSLLVIAITGEVVQYGQQQAILTRLDYLQQQIVEIKKQGATVYRGGS